MLSMMLENLISAQLNRNKETLFARQISWIFCWLTFGNDFVVRASFLEIIASLILCYPNQKLKQIIFFWIIFQLRECKHNKISLKPNAKTVNTNNKKIKLYVSQRMFRLLKLMRKSHNKFYY